MKLQSLLALLFAFATLCGSPLLAANSDRGSPVIEVWKSTTCECCGNWVKHLEANGFAVKVNAADPSMLDHLQKQAGITDKLAAATRLRSTAMSSRATCRRPTSSVSWPRNRRRSA